MKRFLLLLCLFVLFIDLQINATIRYVKPGTSSTVWAGKPSAQVYSDLPTALSAAVKGDEVWVAAGTYKPTTGTNRNISFSIPNGVKVLGGFSGTETSSSARNWNKNQTILSGDIGIAGISTDNSQHVVQFSGTSSNTIESTTELDGFIIEKGYSDQYGGGIYCYYASPVIQNCIIRNNYASNDGGGVYGYSGKPKIVNSIIYNNKSNYGGGICSQASFSLINVTITKNIDNHCGAIENRDGSTTGTNVISWGNIPSSTDGSFTNSCVEGGSGTGVINKDPLFINVSLDDFRLYAQSPCINKGLSSAVPSGLNFDIAKNSRIQNDTVDMGAYEGGVVTPIPVSPVNNSIFKNNASGNSITFNWKWAVGSAPSGTLGYILQYWTDKKDTTSLNVNGLSTTVNLTANKNFYWRVRVIDGSNIINWSVVNVFSISHSAPLYVKSGSTGDGSSWSQAYGDLSTALANAVYGDEVWVAAGTYKPTTGRDQNISFSISKGVKVLGGFAGTETISSARNWNQNKTILSGDIGTVGTNADNSYHVVQFLGTSSNRIDSTTLLDGFIIEKGYGADDGGGINCSYASPVIQNCIIRNNTTTLAGGGVCGCIGNPKIINSLLYNNESTYGGAICSQMSFFTLINVTIVKNTADSQNGAIYNWNNSSTTTGTNVICWGNSPSGTNGSFTNSCIEGGSGTGVINKDPLFVDASNGDFRLIAQSPCINKGLNSVVPSGLSYDLAYNRRIQKDTVDMGVYEGGLIIPVPVSPANNSAIKGNASGTPITFSWKWTAGSAPSGTSGYILQYWTDKKDTVSLNVNDLNTTVSLSAGKKYYWRVRAVDASNMKNWSVVNTFSIYHSGPLYVKPGSTGDGSSWGQAYGDLSTALANSIYGDEVWVAAGTYKPTTGKDRNISFSIPNGVKVLGGFTGTETLSSARNWNKNQTILSGDIGTVGTNTDNSYHVVQFSGTSSNPIDSTTVLDGFIIEKGYSDQNGGGIYCQYSSPVIRNCIIRNNNSFDNGGGIYGYSGKPKIVNSLIYNNKSYWGGAIYSNASFALVNVTIVKNTATYKGAIFCSSGSATGTNVICWGNSPSGTNGSFTNSCVEDGSGTGVINKDPLFIDASNGDFRLNAQSPCINKGLNSVVPSGLSYDLDYNSRIQKDTVDIGAYEGGVITPIAVSPANNKAFKNDASGNPITFSWKWAAGSAPSGTSGYILQYWTNQKDTVSLNVNDLSTTINLSVGKNYYWRVGSIDSKNQKEWSVAYNTFSIYHNGPIYVKSGSTGDGSSWSQAYGDLSTALANAVYGDEVWVAAGTYKPTTGTDRNISFSISKGVKVLGGFAGTETLSSARKWNQNKTILSGDIGTVGTNTDNSYHVVQFLGTSSDWIDSTTLLDGFIIEKGYGTEDGGGINSSYASPVIRNCIIRNNTTTLSGGGVCGYRGAPKIINSLIYNNQSAYGGAICSQTSFFTLINVTIVKNTANNENGAIYNWNNSSTTTGTNVISWGNSPSSTDGLFTYSCIEGGSGTGVITKDPFFIDTSNGDFRLNALSPCINKGLNSAIPSGLSYDLSTNVRIQNDTVDMGAYEGGIVTPVAVTPVNLERLSGDDLFSTIDVKYSWKWESGSAPANVTGYQLQYWKQGGNTTTITSLTQLQSTVSLHNSTRYYWRIGAVYSSQDPIAWSPVYSFNITAGRPIYVKKGTTNGDGSSWNRAYSDLQKALSIALPGDEIWVAAGTYKPTNGNNRDSSFFISNGITVLGGFYGKETSSSARNWNKNKTILSGDIGTVGTNTDNSYHVVQLVGTSSTPIDSTTLLDGFIIEKGYGTEDGGGINSSYASPVIRNCIIRNNTTTLSGGGVCGYRGAPKIINSLMYSNQSAYGGAICSQTSFFTLINVTIVKNTANNKNGAIYNWNNSSTTNGTNVICWGNSPSSTDGPFTYSCIQGGSGTGVINKDPLFVNPASNNFRLKVNSPCINKGLTSVLSSADTLDLDHLPRIAGTTVDMGTYEASYPSIISPQNNKARDPRDVRNGYINFRWTTGTKNEGYNSEPFSAPTVLSTFKIKAWLKGDTSQILVNRTQNEYVCSVPDFNYSVAYQWTVGTVVDSFTYWSDTATFYVGHSHPLYVKSGSSGDGSSWSSAYGELIDALNASYPGDQVWVAAGTYKPTTGTDRNASFKLKSAVALYGGFNGKESFETSRNPNTNLTFLSGDIGVEGDASDNSYHVICDTVSLASDSIVGATVDGFTITGGNSDRGNGGAMLNQFASPTVYNCIFANNHAANGAAIYNGKASSPYIYNSLFYGNTAGTAGGAIYNDATSKPVVINSTITNNTATTGAGVSGGGTIGNTIIYGNSSGEINGSPIVTYSCVKGGYSGTGNVKGNPGFVDVFNNNYRLSGFSSCYNKGSNALLPSGYFSDLDNDESRIWLGVTDIGAYELEKPETVKVDSIDPAQNSIYKNIYGPVVVYFHQPVQRMNLSKIQITPAVALQNSSLNSDSTQLTLNFKTPWSFDQDYGLKIAANSVAYADNNLIGTRDTSLIFKIRSCIPATIELDKTATLYCPDVSATLKVDTVKGDGNSDFKWYYGANLLSKFNGLNKMNTDSISDKTLGLYKCKISDMCGLQAADSINLAYKANITYPEIVKKWNDILLVKNPDGLFSNYVWKYYGSEIGKNVQYITYNRYGTYDVWATDAGSGCTVHGQYMVDSKKNASIKIYPNPIHVSDIVNIDFGEQKSGTIRLFDMKGVQVYSGVFNAEVQYRFNNTNLMPGVYLLEIVSDGELTVNKLVINK